MNAGRPSPTVICAYRQEELAPHLPAWQALAQDAAFGEWWAGPNWILPWMDAFGADISLAVHFVYDGPRLRGVVPFIAASRNGTDVARLTLPVNSHVRRVGWLADEPVSVLSAVLKDLRHRYPTAAIALPQIPRLGPWADAVRRATTMAGLQAWTTPQTSSAVASFTDGWPAYVRGRDSKLLRNLRRHWKRLDPADGWRVALCRDLTDLPAQWDAVLSIESRSWKHANGSSIETEPGAANLYGHVAQRFAQQRALRLWVLYQHDVPVAHALAVVDRGVFYLLKNSYDEQFRSWSPGMALVWHAMENAASEGIQRTDFLGDAADWKRPLSTDLPEYESWLLFPAWHLRAQGLRFIDQVLKPPVRAFRAWRSQRHAAPLATS